MIMKILKLKISLIMAIGITLGLLKMQASKIEIENLNTQLQIHEQVTKQLLGMPIDRLTTVKVTVTSYNPTRKQCDNTPLYGSDGGLVTPGILAVSQDLRKKYGIKDGDRVILEGYGQFVVKDSMHPRWRKRVDIMSLIPRYSEKFGAKPNISLYFNANSVKNR